MRIFTKLFELLSLTNYLFRRIKKMAATVVELDAAIASLRQSIQDLDGRIKALPGVPVDLQPQVDAVNALRVQVDAEAK